MPKVLVGFLLVLLLAGLGAGVFLFARYSRTDTQVGGMIAIMSSVETARIKMHLERFSQEGEPGFVFGDMNVAGVVDLRPAGSAYDLSFDVAAVPGASAERARLDLRRVDGKLFVRMVEGPPVLSDTLARLGLLLNSWAPLESSAQALELLGESKSTPSALSEPLLTLRGRVATTKWFLNPQATLTEIVHGKVTRLVAADLNPTALAEFLGTAPRPEWEGARANLWIDQSSYELRRMILQFANGTEVDVEFEELNADVAVESPEALPEAGDQGPEAGIGGANTPRLEAEPEPEPVSDDRDGDGLTDDLEGFYRSRADNPDTDGDGYTDGEEVKNGYSPTGPGTLFNFGLPTL